MDQGLSIECLIVPLLQLLGTLRDELLDLLILAAECGGKRLLTSGKVFFLGVERDMALR